MHLDEEFLNNIWLITSTWDEDHAGHILSLAESAMGIDEPLAASTLWGAVLEGIVIAFCNLKNLKTSDKLGEMIEKIENGGYLDGELAKKAHRIREFRNYIHPDVVKNQSGTIDRRKVFLMVRDLRDIADYLVEKLLEVGVMDGESMHLEDKIHFFKWAFLGVLECENGNKYEKLEKSPYYLKLEIAKKEILFVVNKFEILDTIDALGSLGLKMDKNIECMTWKLVAKSKEIILEYYKDKNNKIKELKFISLMESIAYLKSESKSEFLDAFLDKLLDRLDMGILNKMCQYEIYPDYIYKIYRINPKLDFSDRKTIIAIERSENFQYKYLKPVGIFETAGVIDDKFYQKNNRKN